ncbi:hypothetical protein DL546_006118 [Coniochaeta pulveracea]|uniref:Hydrophobin n=1 Tax=Coniochaeta pulveracea TaxID=177199 RepID=A0A420YFC5_9PEZI|nr:hypothetical protein DL546_006118 [Coniochaeta pulveracea]
MANTTCGDPTAIPELSSLPIPQDINVLAVPGSNVSSAPMVTCCQPNPVHVVNNCTLWCEIPKSYFDNGASHDTVSAALSTCLRTNMGNSTSPSAAGFQFNSGVRTGGWTVKELGVFVLGLSGLMYAL